MGAVHLGSAASGAGTAAAVVVMLRTARGERMLPDLSW